MTVHQSFAQGTTPARLSTDKPLSLAILAMGGQGGGVLADWIVATAEGAGWVAQSTSVPGVAQRTGATIYYLEMLPGRDGQAPILSLMPTPGDVDVVLAAEFMEAGRSMLRGLVTPDRTTLITSSHRSYAVGEKEVPGDGVGDPESVVTAAGVAAKRIVAFDMQTLAEKNGSVISATMFGALAGSGLLPFPREAFEAAIRAGGKGVEPSLRAFSAGFDRVVGGAREIVPKAPGKDLPEPPARVGVPALDALLARIAALPRTARAMAFAGVKRLVDYQDTAYAGEYLTVLEALHALDRRHGGAGKEWSFTQGAAKYLAVAMAYDDVLRVADLKTRSARTPRIRREVGAKDDQILGLTEYMHPRMEEVAGTLPARIGHAIEDRPKLFSALDRLVNRGRRVRTDRIHWFLALYLVAGLKRFRRGSLRHEREAEHWKRWLDGACAVLPENYDLAVAILSARRLVKGYSDTHARGHSKFDRVLSAVPLLRGQADGGAWLHRLIKAALLDEEGKALDGALLTVASAYEPS
ncbi:indolepyruvate oxidoreductase subunit beta family protein [Aurantimonas sp. Leaf443]|uniref:indolepyruvate oxidoreductase subunit beta family protein n=1 Tax=Aurantimonas sp. Leaf443 TaxID=1736378 RepID=UPI0006FC0958|nr:indolepyruvate oxidoreductase subunit beta family protein [Aurantimonas sp. Leaf443]KQT83841.1 indolepyruvate oxidoreductase subunit B [Aurantimonas sp. Leaf443]